MTHILLKEMEWMLNVFNAYRNFFFLIIWFKNTNGLQVTFESKLQNYWMIYTSASVYYSKSQISCSLKKQKQKTITYYPFYTFLSSRYSFEKLPFLEILNQFSNLKNTVFSFIYIYTYKRNKDFYAIIKLIIKIKLRIKN